MKDFFSEYGKLIIVGALVVLVLMFTTPFGQAVTGSIAGFTSGFHGKTSATLANVKIGEKIKKYELEFDADGNGVISKGDLIELERDYIAPDAVSGDWMYYDDHRQVRVLDWDGTYAKIAFIYMSDESVSFYDDGDEAAHEVAYTDVNNASQTTHEYSGSNVDVYCENKFYNLIGTRAKMDVLSRPLEQNVYSQESSDGTAVLTGFTGTQVYLNGSLGTITRNVHALSIDDIANYFSGSSFSETALSDMYNIDHEVDYPLQLMSMCKKGTRAYNFAISNSDGQNADICRTGTKYTYHVVPVLTINLS